MNFQRSLLTLAALVAGGQHLLAQCTNQVTHLSGTTAVAGVNVTVTPSGITSSNSSYCALTQPYFIGYGGGIGNMTGAFTFNFSPAISGFTVHVSGTSNSGGSVEEVRLYVNGSHYAIPSIGPTNGCDALGVLTPAGDVGACAGCGVSGWRNINVSGSISSLRVEDFVLGGTPNGSIFSLLICNVILPEETMAFEATLEPSGGVGLQWTTTTEVNSDFFQVERSVNGMEWRPIAEVDAVGNSGGAAIYRAGDAMPPKGEVQYRVKQVNMDGEGSYSEVRTVDVGTSRVRVYPNPARGEMILEGDGLEGTEIVLLNMLGQEVMRTEGTETKTRVDLRGVHPGTYMLRVGGETKRIVVE